MYRGRRGRWDGQPANATDLYGWLRPLMLKSLSEGVTTTGKEPTFLSSKDSRGETFPRIIRIIQFFKRLEKFKKSKSVITMLKKQRGGWGGGGDTSWKSREGCFDETFVKEGTMLRSKKKSGATQNTVVAHAEVHRNSTCTLFSSLTLSLSLASFLIRRADRRWLFPTPSQRYTRFWKLNHRNSYHALK